MKAQFPVICTANVEANRLNTFFNMTYGQGIGADSHPALFLVLSMEDLKSARRPEPTRSPVSGGSSDFIEKSLKDIALELQPEIHHLGPHNSLSTLLVVLDERSLSEENGLIVQLKDDGELDSARVHFDTINAELIRIDVITDDVAETRELAEKAPGGVLRTEGQKKENAHENNTTSSDIRCFASTLPAKASLPSPQRVILNTLEHLKHDKWGFVIYRCTYQDDKAWTRFKQIVFENTQNEMQRSDAPEVADKLEWTFVEDRAALDGASRSQLRERFKQWAAQAIIAEQPRAQAQAQEDSLFGIPRYNYFIQIDEEALQSVLAAPRNDPSGEGFVNFVDARWNPLGDIYPEDEDERYDPIDECTEENVGWMRIATMMIDTEWYDAAINFASGGWFVYYLRPPKIVLY
ncbi:hypothetical protein KC340_g16011 [Hortaea werneckii]|nr:hypothetical protein KC342_g16334 [Hortaea werneckii]KAI7060939.1 hypothetical protein KC339_g16944 [Hortaea werneckii]KAI7212630.1 hypothetical protein KC365_g14546 [Hortaea werneckii]KAI7294813.1 hypothetical protein KC340_g16011 [Hortaea werneckii]KAI7373759.1 hypothetical protein KC328_g16425 [Hortaea werneckii]